MSGRDRIAVAHRSRKAVVYLRQSTMMQVRENTESTARQYALAELAERLGWPGEAVVVIDHDLGVSGRFSGTRQGFAQLISLVCLGEVGAIFALEVSRLARSSAEFARLLEFARLTDTLLIDSDGVYDLSDFNDRLILGVKSTMSEAELHLLAGRLHGARRAAAAEGRLRVGLPVGMVYDSDGRIVLDPDEQVQAAIRDVYGFFDQHGSALAVVRAFADRPFPRRDTGVWDGRLGWGRLTHGRAASVLKNPVYAGAYAYGRNVSTSVLRPDGTVGTAVNRRPREGWAVLIPEHHEGYITWAKYLEIEARLAGNRTGTGARPPREGVPLCQGIIFCGSCGMPRTTSYRRADGSCDYVCTRARSDATATAGCHSIASAAVDVQVEKVFLASITPEQITIVLEAAELAEARHARSHRAAELALERARYDAARAERAFTRVDPDNRLVARTLEKQWEEKLRALSSAEQELSDQIAARPAPPDRERLAAMAADLAALWRAETTTAKDRKRLLRTVIADVTIRHVDDQQAHLGIRWHTGAVDEITCDRRTNRNPTAALAIAHEMLETHSDQQVADHLNTLGFKTGNARAFTAESVKHIRKQHGSDHPRSNPALPGEITVPEAASILGIHEATIYPWLRNGEMKARQARHRRWCIEWNETTERYWRERVTTSHHLKRPTPNPRNETEQAV
jgi:excisionase family DNA binding protein